MEKSQLFAILLDIGVSDLTHKFEAKQITIENLPTLPLSVIKEIVPENRIKEFLEKREQYFGLVGNKTAEINPNSNLETVNSSQNSQVLKALDINARPKKLFAIENVNIRNILDNSFEGRRILSWYENKKRLDQSKRKKVTHFVISSILNDCERDLITDDFMILSKKIKEEFPSECEAVYFSPHVSKNKSSSGKLKKASGKLLYKYFNLKKVPLEERTTKKGGKEQQQVENVSQEASEDVKCSIEWLKTNEEPWENVKKHWTTTYNYRYSQIGSECSSSSTRILSVYEQWPILKTPKGYELIDIDFSLGKFSNIENAISNFHKFYSEISNVRPLKKNDQSDMLKTLLEAEDLNDNEKTFIEMILLCYMLPSTARIPQGMKKFWKPTCCESFDGIINHVKIYGDIGKKQHERRLFAASKKITVQPYIIVVGEGDFDVSSIYLVIDEIIYEIPTLLQALDICFKSFHTWNAKYSVQSEQIWLILQLGLYKFRTRWDKNIIGVQELLNDMGHELPALN